MSDIEEFAKADVWTEIEPLLKKVLFLLKNLPRGDLLDLTEDKRDAYVRSYFTNGAIH